MRIVVNVVWKRWTPEGNEYEGATEEFEVYSHAPSFEIVAVVIPSVVRRVPGACLIDDVRVEATFSAKGYEKPIRADELEVALENLIKWELPF
ncbi:hypothetical protein FDH93_gp025 [Pseudomonas phage vB_PaeM_G1]|uniref:Uncharacterized protein n=1 Tax=Pseudomonas phage vB_PaeM_G1 TaxID=1983539 RepID=A0A218L3S8_9CAUD|nr:hypothetical protein FDH93_gp025 [Pseudomonas phage vB_PaeM_G1]ARW57292.1 hypothetical protein vBPaeMG1_025 [Pseudomonas phage vB_PaeM_G1]